MGAIQAAQMMKEVEDVGGMLPYIWFSFRAYFALANSLNRFKPNSVSCAYLALLFVACLN